MRIKPFPLLLAACGMCALPALAQTLYKLVDKNGKVTYSESPPKDFDGKVIRMDIDPKANTATMPKPRDDSEARRAAQAADDRVRAARERLEAARKALADARANPGEGDVARIGTKSGGSRPVETEGYQKRLAKLEGDVKEAEESLQKAQKER